MKVSIWDTYVQKKDGKIMHFDIVMPEGITEEQTIHKMGKQYLKLKGQQQQELSYRQCSFCHNEIASEEMEASIKNQGYCIIEMEGCD